jgi:hypothetical protein
MPFAYRGFADRDCNFKRQRSSPPALYAEYSSHGVLLRQRPGTSLVSPEGNSNPNHCEATTGRSLVTTL